MRYCRSQANSLHRENGSQEQGGGQGGSEGKKELGQITKDQKAEVAERGPRQCGKEMETDRRGEKPTKTESKRKEEDGER